MFLLVFHVRGRLLIEQKEIEQKRRRKSKAQFFEMIREVRRYQQEEKDIAEEDVAQEGGDDDDADDEEEDAPKTDRYLYQPDVENLSDDDHHSAQVWIYGQTIELGHINNISSKLFSFCRFSTSHFGVNELRFFS